jgi:hypothetical protein
LNFADIHIRQERSISSAIKLDAACATISEEDADETQITSAKRNLSVDNGSALNAAYSQSPYPHMLPIESILQDIADVVQTPIDSVIVATAKDIVDNTKAIAHQIPTYGGRALQAGGVDMKTYDDAGAPSDNFSNASIAGKAIEGDMRTSTKSNGWIWSEPHRDYYYTTVDFSGELPQLLKPRQKCNTDNTRKPHIPLAQADRSGDS